MNDIGFASTTRSPDSRPSTTWDRLLWLLNLPPIRSASRSATMNPTLWRFPAYSGPGLPRPTTSHGPAALSVTSPLRRSAQGLPPEPGDRPYVDVTRESGDPRIRPR